MCLVHDLIETRTGDLNYVQKKYVVADEPKAVADLTREIPFGQAIGELFEEFNAQQTEEARLAHDADQIALILELKALGDSGYDGPQDWLPYVVSRLQTELGEKLAKHVLETPSDEWWFKEKRDDI